MQNQGREHHGEDRHRSGCYTGIDGRSDAQPDGITALIGDQSKGCRTDKEQQIPLGHWFLRQKKGGNPKKQGPTRYPERDHINASQPMHHGIFAQRSHQPPESAGKKETQMSQ